MKQHNYKGTAKDYEIHRKKQAIAYLRTAHAFDDFDRADFLEGRGSFVRSSSVKRLEFFLQFLSSLSANLSFSGHVAAFLNAFQRMRMNS